MAETPQSGDAVLERAQDKTKTPQLYRVVMLNDDYTTMEFVVSVLEGVFQKSPAEAFRLDDAGAHGGGGDLWHVHATKWPKRRLKPFGRWHSATGFPLQAAIEEGWTHRMFSASLELILNVAYREAASRRHTHLTLEHLLYALAHDPEGERILAACGADLPALRRVLDEFLGTLESFGKGERVREPAQTLGFRRVLQTAVLHVQSAGKDEVRSGDVLAAILQQSKAYAAQLLETQGITRLDILNYISHGISKVPLITGDSESRTDRADSGVGDEGPATAADPLSAYAVNLTEKAQKNLLDPLIGRVGELRRTMEILCRRRKNNPVFVGDAGVGKTALAEGLAVTLLAEDVPARLKGAEVFALDTAALLAGTRFRGDFEERFKGVVAALATHPMPILFIDEVHTTVRCRGHNLWHHGSRYPDQADSDRRRAAGYRLDDVRGFQARREGSSPRSAPPRKSSSRNRRSRRQPRFLTV